MSKRLLAEAHRYLGLGYPVVAVTGKRPVVPWLAYCGRMPGEAELGKQFARPEVTGLALVIGPALWERHRYLWVLDVEARHRQAAEAWLAERLPHWRQGRVAETGSGGLHLHLVASTPPRTHPCAFGDVKGERSVAVLPPSLHPKGSYRWLHEGEPHALDPEAVPPPPSAPRVAREPAYAALAATEPIPEGQRHQVLTSLGGLLRRAGLSAADLDATLQAVNRRRCAPPLPEAEVRRIAESLARYPTAAQAAGAGEESRPIAQTHPPIDPAAVDRLLMGEPTYLRPRRSDRPTITFLTPAELMGQVPAAIPWLWQNYLVRGAVTVLAGREKTGKSTLLWALIAALLHGQEFCGQPVVQTPVVVLSEETDLTLSQKFTRLGLSVASPLSLRPRTGLVMRPRWEDTVMACAREAERTGAGLVVVDTLSWWAALPAEAENDAGAMTAALRPLLALSQQGPAVLAVHHMTKATGELRGSSAIGAMADVIITLSREKTAPNRRVLEVIGRFADLTPEPQIIELEESGQYKLIGNHDAVTMRAISQRLIAELATSPAGLATSELVELLGVGPRAVRRALQEAQAAGLIAAVNPAGDRRRVRYTLRSTKEVGMLDL